LTLTLTLTRLMRLADRLAAAAEQSDVQQVGGYLAQVQQQP